MIDQRPARAGAVVLLAAFALIAPAAGADLDRTLNFDIREVSSRTLRISWRPEAGDVKAALRGTLTIRDGAETRSLDLSAAQLGLGSLLYRDQSGAVIVCLRLKEMTRELPTHCIAHISGPVLAGLAPRK